MQRYMNFVPFKRYMLSVLSILNKSKTISDKELRHSAFFPVCLSNSISVSVVLPN